MKQYDLVVLGAGPGGYIAAIRASQLGLHTAIVEQRYWGGVCLNVGCIPAKALLRNAEVARLVTREAAAFGVASEATITVDYGAAFRRSRAVADGRARGVHYLMRKNGIAMYEGWGTFADPHTVDVALHGGGRETLAFAHAIIATGATPRLLPGTRLGERVVTYERQILAERLPGSAIIAGAGAIGVEFATILASYGVRVTLVEFADRVVPLEDEEVSAELHRQYRRTGIEILTSTRVEAIEDTGEGVRVAVTTAQGERRVLGAELVLQALGFRPRTGGYGLERTGVALTGGGAIAVDGAMRTSVPHLYAIGDVTGKLMLAHVAEAMGLAAAERIAGVPPVTLDYAMLPRATYGHPQVASFGHTERRARELGHDVAVATFPFQANGKAQALGEAAGFAKLVGDRRTGELLGAHLIGPDVTELLPELTLARGAELTAEEIARNVHAHPTVGEVLREVAHGLATGRMLNL